MRAPDESLAHEQIRTVKGPKDTALAWISKARSSRVALAAVGLLAGGIVLGVAFATWRLARRPEVVVVSPFGGPMYVELDDARVLTADSVAVETPGAGRTLRPSPGRHKLVAKVPVEDGEPRVVFERWVIFSPWAAYLFAPPSEETCFYVEHTAYGSAPRERVALEVLDPVSTPWLLPDRVDGWFVPTPRGGVEDKRSTGGTRTSVRQARCGTTPYR